ncbi:MAG: hypothetical protein ABSB33_06855, partial [Tepidisphaeraceae bacterium]
MATSNVPLAPIDRLLKFSVVTCQVVAGAMVADAPDAIASAPMSIDPPGTAASSSVPLFTFTVELPAFTKLNG